MSILWLALPVLAMSVLFSGLGIGGGAFYIPMLTSVGLTFPEAVAVSLGMIVSMSVSATAVYLRRGLIDPWLILYLEPLSVATAFGAGLMSGAIPETALRVAFAVVVLPTAWWMARSGEIAPRRAPATGRWIKHRTTPHGDYHVSPGLAALVAMLAGSISGFLGLGGGVVKVPAMVLLFGVPMRVAVANAGVMIGLTSLAGFLGHVSSGDVRWGYAAVGAAAVFLGGQLGARLVLHVPQKAVRRVFAVVLVALGCWIVAEMFVY